MGQGVWDSDAEGGELTERGDVEGSDAPADQGAARVGDQLMSTAPGVVHWSKPKRLKVMTGNSWGSKSYAYKFLCLDSAKYMLEDINANGKIAFIEWHDESACPKLGAFGEVNPAVL